MNEFKLSCISKHRDFPFHIELGAVNGSFPMHTHNFCEIFFAASGSGVHLAGDYEYTLEKGELFAVKGSEEHSFTNCRDFKLYNIMFRTGDLDTADCKTLPGFWVLFLHEQQLGNISHLKLDPEDFNLVKNWCDTMLYEYTQGKSGFQAVCKGILTELIVFLSRKCQSLPENEVLPDFRLAKALVYMETNFHLDLTLENLAKIVGLSPRHFTRIFKQIYGVSPINHLLSLRMERAKQLLAAGECSVTQVSDLCGFKDVNYFSGFFKEKTGVTPSLWKKQNNVQSTG